jgi:hypothetical protein
MSSRIFTSGLATVLFCVSAYAQSPPVIVANPASGSADYGIAGGSQPIQSVTVSDTINGSQIVLGPGGNAILTKGPNWPASDLGLNPNNGAVSTFASTPEGTYTASYVLCAAAVPTDCQSAPITVTVVPVPMLVTNPISGTADSGTPSQPIAIVTANDTVNGQPVVLSGSGTNAQIKESTPWPNGIGLDPTTGAVSTKISSQDGTYNLQYLFGDLNRPAQYITGNLTVTIISASILANPVTCSGAPGALQCNVVTGGNGNIADTVDGQTVTLPASNNGNPVNAQLTIDGNAWPMGIVLNSGTGAVTASKAVAPGTYSLQYKLCDLNVPANCGASTLALDIETSLVVNAQSGTATLSVNSTPIKNVVSGDTINGVQCRLQTSPNCTVSASGTWPSGIALNTTTGAVTVASTVKLGFYDTMYYTVCSVVSPGTCQSAPVTIQVDTSLTVLPVAGSAVVNTAAVAIGNVLINDVVNGAAATLANATVTQESGWTPGINLNTNAGIAAITVAATVPVGTYGTTNFPLKFKVCERAYPTVCNTASATVSVTAPFTEVSVSPYMTGDIEFDWGRDGRYCATCNFGSSNSQVNWTDRDSNLWVNYVNPVTGLFTPSSGRETNVTTNAFFWQDWGNGPEWAFSTPAAGQDPVSQLVYTGFAAGSPPNGTYEYAESEFASETANSGGVGGTATWQPVPFPGAYAPPRQNTVLPLASQCVTDSFASALFENLLTPTQMFTETLSTATGTQPVLTPFGALANGIGERYVACAHDANSPYPQSTRWLIFEGDVTIGNNVLQQVFWYDMDNPTQQALPLTFDPTTKQRAIMFKAPDFPDANGNAQYVLMTVAADQQIEVFVQTGTNPNGSPIMTLVNTIYSPDPGESYMFDPKAFVNCTPKCVSYVVMALGTMAESQQTETVPNGIGVATLNPANPFFEVLVPANAVDTATGQVSQRLDPKVYITDAGPVVYYDLLNILTTTSPYNDQGIYMINMGLGSPQGNCVGWSAYDGPNNTYNSNNPAPNYCTQPTSNYPIN